MIRLFTLAFVFAPLAASQNATLDALLNEVRQLRLAIENSNSIVPRLQLLMQRVQIQDAKVTRISRELQDVRNRLADHMTQTTRIRSGIQELEGRVSSAATPAEKKEPEVQLRQLKLEAETFAATEQQIRQRENELTSQFRLEESTLEGYQSKLDALEKSLEPVRPR